MKASRNLPHLLRVDRTLLEFAPLVAALRQDGQRAGWLEWAPGAPPAPSPFLPESAAAGVARAVRVDGERTMAVKNRRGAPVLRDVLREHFHGSSPVLVHLGGESSEPALQAAPRLEAASAGWRVVAADGETKELTTEQLVAALRRPRPFAKEKKDD